MFLKKNVLHLAACIIKTKTSAQCEKNVSSTLMQMMDKLAAFNYT